MRIVHPMPFVGPYAVLFWAIFVWAFLPESGIVKRASEGDTSDDAGSMRVIVIGNELAMFFGFLVAWIVPAATFATDRIAAYWAGSGLFLAGALLRRHCFRVLGKFFSGAVTVQADHQVVDHGAYRWVRHPSYTGGIAIFLGIGLALGNWISIALLVAIPLAVYSYRIAVEERALLLRIGEPYRDYMGRTKRLIPFVI